MRAAPAGVAQCKDIPAGIHALDALSSDYIDLFIATAAGASDLSAEQWARVALEESSALGRFVAWRMLLGLRLDRQPSSKSVAGWQIADRGDGWIRLEAQSWHMTANIIFQVESERVSFATLVRYDNPVAILVWTPVSMIHRRLAPDVLRGAVARVNRRR